MLADYVDYVHNAQLLCQGKKKQGKIDVFSASIIKIKTLIGFRDFYLKGGHRHLQIFKEIAPVENVALRQLW